MAELTLELRSDPALVCQLRRKIESFAAEQGFDEVSCGDIGLCVNEAFTNVIRHAYHNRHDQPIHFEARLLADDLVMQLRDWGNARAPDLRRVAPFPNPLKPGGLGLPCLKQLMDRIEFIEQPDGMLLKMVRGRR